MKQTALKRLKLEEGKLLLGLNSEEKVILMKAYIESKNRKNLLTHYEVMKKYSKWLTK